MKHTYKKHWLIEHDSKGFSNVPNRSFSLFISSLLNPSSVNFSSLCDFLTCEVFSSLHGSPIPFLEVCHIAFIISPLCVLASYNKCTIYYLCFFSIEYWYFVPFLLAVILVLQLKQTHPPVESRVWYFSYFLLQKQWKWFPLGMVLPFFQEFEPWPIKFRV